MVRTNVATAVSSIAPTSGITYPGDAPDSTRSMKKPLNAGAIRPGITSSTLASSTRAKARPVRVRRRSRESASRLGRPPRRNSGPGSKVRTIPVNPESNSFQSIQRGPLAGSLMRMRVFPHRRRIVSTTRKCWNAQKMMAGSGTSRSALASVWKPRAVRPYRRAAATTDDALAPSRDTPQTARSSSSGTNRP